MNLFGKQAFLHKSPPNLPFSSESKRFSSELPRNYPETTPNVRKLIPNHPQTPPMCPKPPPNFPKSLPNLPKVPEPTSKLPHSARNYPKPAQTHCGAPPLMIPDGLPGSSTRCAPPTRASPFRCLLHWVRRSEHAAATTYAHTCRSRAAVSSARAFGSLPNANIEDTHSTHRYPSVCMRRESDCFPLVWTAPSQNAFETMAQRGFAPYT